MQNQLISDGALIKGYLEGNESAFETLVSRHKTKVFSAIYLMVNDVYIAEDIFQETFIKMVDLIKNGRYNHEDKFINYVVRIARNMAIDYLRVKKKTPTIVDSEGKNVLEFVSEKVISVEENMLQTEDAKFVHALLNKLPEDQREIIVLRHYTDLSFKEISELLNININTCIGRMHYGLLNMRRMLKKNAIQVK